MKIIPARNMIHHASVLAAVCLALSGCSPSGSDSSTASATQVNAAGTDRLFLETAPGEALSVKEARETLQAGDPIVLSGQVGGADEPFVQGFAAFVLADTDILFCDEMEEHGCPTPWDACCEDPDELSASRAIVQFLDDAGEILPLNLKGANGLKELSHVTVRGVVSDQSTPANLIVLAERLYVE